MAFSRRSISPPEPVDPVLGAFHLLLVLEVPAVQGFRRIGKTLHQGAVDLVDVGHMAGDVRQGRVVFLREQPADGEPVQIVPGHHGLQRFQEFGWRLGRRRQPGLAQKMAQTIGQVAVGFACGIGGDQSAGADNHLLVQARQLAFEFILELEHRNPQPLGLQEAEIDHAVQREVHDDLPDTDPLIRAGEIRISHQAQLFEGLKKGPAFGLGRRHLLFSDTRIAREDRFQGNKDTSLLVDFAFADLLFVQKPQGDQQSGLVGMNAPLERGLAGIAALHTRDIAARRVGDNEVELGVPENGDAQNAQEGLHDILRAYEQIVQFGLHRIPAETHEHVRHEALLHEFEEVVSGLLGGLDLAVHRGDQGPALLHDLLDNLIEIADNLTGELGGDHQVAHRCGPGLQLGDKALKMGQGAAGVLGVGDDLRVPQSKRCGELAALGGETVGGLHGARIHVGFDPPGVGKPFEHPRRPVGHRHFCRSRHRRIIVQGRRRADTGYENIQYIHPGEVVAVVSLGSVEAQVEVADARHGHLQETPGERAEKVQGFVLEKKFVGIHKPGEIVCVPLHGAEWQLL